MRQPALTAAAAPADLITIRSDAAGLLTCYLVLLMGIPASLVVGSLGQAGAPASLFGSVLLCWYLAARLHPAYTPDTGPQPIRAVAIFFSASILVSYVAANRAAMPAVQVSGADRGLLLLTGWLGILLVAADGIDDMDRLTTLLRRIVLGASAMAALGIVEFGTGTNLSQYITVPGLSLHSPPSDLMNRDGLSRVMATTSQPLELAAVLTMSLPLALHQARLAPAGRRLRYWIPAALIAAAIPLTVSRSALAGLVVICLVLFPTWPRRDRRLGYLILLGAPVLVWLAQPSVLSSFGTLFGQLGTDQSSKSRSGALASAAPFLAHHPWFGQGFKTFFPATYFFVDDQYITSLIETGIAGGLALAALFVTGWLTARSARIAATDARTRDLAQSLAASVAVAAVCFAVFDALSFSVASGMLFLLLGCTGALWRLARAERQASASPR